MFAELVARFDSLGLQSVLGVAGFLLVLEYALEKGMSSQVVSRLVMVNSWRFFGVLFPGLWLLRCAKKYSEAIMVGMIIVIFGIIKPTWSRVSDG